MLLKNRILIILFILSIFLINCYKEKKTNRNNFLLLSSSFNSKNILKKKHLGRDLNGSNISIDLKWENPPLNTKFFALIMFDNNPFSNKFIYWAILNIPNNINNIKKNSSLVKMPINCIELNNFYGYKGYGGPNFENSEIVVELFAINNKITEINEIEFYTYQDIINIIEKYIIAKTSITGRIK